MSDTKELFKEAFETRDIQRFMTLVFPPEWAAVTARIMESGVTMSMDLCSWAPRWSPVPPTIRTGPDELSTWVKSCIFRAHDCIHQLWGLPTPGSDQFTEEDFYLYKRAQMCGEVAVLTLTEFVLVKRFAEMHPVLQPLLWKRNALPMLDGPLRNRTLQQITARLDTLLHKKLRPKWVREHPISMAFCDDYVPMLEDDRRAIDHNWDLMKMAKWLPTGAPNARYSKETDGLELTMWMINDFFHLLDTDAMIDAGLVSFNRERRSLIILPKSWNEPN